MIKGEKTLIELSQGFDVQPNQIKQWRDQLLEGATGICIHRLTDEPPIRPASTRQSRKRLRQDTRAKPLTKRP